MPATYAGTEEETVFETCNVKLPLLRCLAGRILYLIPWKQNKMYCMEPAWMMLLLLSVNLLSPA